MEELPAIGTQRYFHTNGFQNHKRNTTFDYNKKKYFQKKNYFKEKQELNNNMNYMSDYILSASTNKDDINSNKNDMIITSYSKNNKGNFNKTNNINNNNNISPQTYYKYFEKINIKNSKDKIISKSYKNFKNFQDDINAESDKNNNLLLPDFQKDKNKEIKQNSEYNFYSTLNKENNNNPKNSMNIIKKINKDTIYSLKYNLINYHHYSQKKNTSGKNIATIGFLPNKNQYSYLKSKTYDKKRGIFVAKKDIKPINILNNNNNMSKKKNVLYVTKKWKSIYIDFI
jgi:hypothetical protein